MKIYTQEEIISMIHSRQNINFLATAITPWHALGINANIYLLEQQGIELKGFIMVVAHPMTGTAIEESNFEMQNSKGIEVVGICQNSLRNSVLSSLKRKINKYCYYLFLTNKNIEKLYWAVPMKPSYEFLPLVDTKSFQKHIITILIDEGLGTYLDSDYVCCKWAFREGGTKAGIYSVWHTFVRDKFYMFQLKRKKAIIFKQLLYKKSYQWLINKTVVNAYRKTMKKEKLTIHTELYSGTVVINSNMLFEIGIFSERIDIQIYKELCERLRKNNIKVIIKPHPREKEIEVYQELNCDIEVKCTVAQESIFAGLQVLPICLIGFDTTTLVSSKILFGIEGISLNQLVHPKYLNDKNRFHKFNKIFSNIVYVPKTMDELIEFVQFEKARERKYV